LVPAWALVWVVVLELALAAVVPELAQL